MPRFTPWILLAGDLIALFLFTYIGQRQHGLLAERQPLPGLLLTTGILAAPWVVAGWALGAFPRRGPLAVRSLLGRSLNAWLVAGPLAVLLRAYVLGRAVIPTTFVAVALGLGGAFLLGWRLVWALLWARRRSH